MSKYFRATTRHAKTQEFFELRQRTMTVMEYVARFTKLARCMLAILDEHFL